jgi:hypothetical protein
MLAKAQAPQRVIAVPHDAPITPALLVLDDDPLLLGSNASMRDPGGQCKTSANAVL